MNHKFTTESNAVESAEFNYKGDSFKITIFEIKQEIGDGVHESVFETIVFNPPVEVETSKFVGENYFTISWDFGMTWKCPQEEWGEVDFNDHKFKESILNGVFYDLEHAFFHTLMDPNYGTKHYALLGCLCLRGRSKKIRPDGTIEIIDYIP